MAHDGLDIAVVAVDCIECKSYDVGDGDCSHQSCNYADVAVVVVVVVVGGVVVVVVVVAVVVVVYQSHSMLSLSLLLQVTRARHPNPWVVEVLW